MQLSVWCIALLLIKIKQAKVSDFPSLNQQVPIPSELTKIEPFFLCSPQVMKTLFLNF